MLNLLAPTEDTGVFIGDGFCNSWVANRGAPVCPRGSARRGAAAVPPCACRHRERVPQVQGLLRVRARRRRDAPRQRGSAPNGTAMRMEPGGSGASVAAGRHYGLEEEEEEEEEQKYVLVLLYAVLIL